MASIVYLHEGPVTLNNGITGESWQVQTANPVNFRQVISDPGTLEPIAIHAQNFLPPGVECPPVVIVVPGSAGLSPNHIEKAELFTNAGWAACLIDPFGARGVVTTAANQAQYSFAASAWDVVCTAEQLPGTCQIDVDRVGTQGHSRGGAAVLSALCMSKLIGVQQRIAGVYAAYPWCGQQFLNPDIGSTKVRSVVGDQDDWCLPQQIQGYMQAMRLTGGDASTRIFAGAHHSFDRDTPVEYIEIASVSPGAPTVYIRDDGATLHPVTEEPVESERDLMIYGIKAGYGVRGAHMGTSGDFADQFHEDMMSFWRSCFA